MGMFDEVVGHGLACPAGHPLGVMQTKDLENLLYRYEIIDNKFVFGFERIPRWVDIYTSCEQCAPERVVTTLQGTTVSIYPWCEFRLELDRDGTILAVTRL